MHTPHIDSTQFLLMRLITGEKKKKKEKNFSLFQMSLGEEIFIQKVNFK